MNVDHGGEFWNAFIGTAFGFISGIINQWIKDDWTLNGFTQTGISTIEGTVTATVGPIAGALISGASSAVGSAISGNSSEQIVTDSLLGVGSSLVGSGIQLAVGRVFEGEFIEKATKTQLKTFANSLGYVGRNYKTKSLWTGKIMYDASKQYMNRRIAQFTGQTTSAIVSVARGFILVK